MPKALLDNLIHITLRVMFSFIAFLALGLIFMSLIDFPKYEGYILPLQLVKAKPERISRNLWVGGYMDREEMLKFLKRNRIQVVISLLDKDMHHESMLLEYERAFLKRAGVTFISVPIKPLIRSDRNVSKLRYYLMRYKNRRVYVHSYLGRLRTKYVKEVLYAGKSP